MIIHTKAELEAREANTLAPYALKSADSKGRSRPEANTEKFRTNFQQDRDRIIHSKAFRRLKGKTQVLSPGQEGDHYRDRLTHTVAVSQISRDLARNLNLNEDAAEAIALAHDLGHTPFGHAGEEALNECLQHYDLEFEHNQQSKRVVTKIEPLNLSFEIIEGLEKHQTPFDQVNQTFVGASLEAQVVNLADEIAYLNHDLDDGLRLGVIKLSDLSKLSLWQQNQDQTISSLMKLMVTDLLMNSANNIEARELSSLEQVYQLKDTQLVAFSPAMRTDVNQLRAYLFKNYYLTEPVQSVARAGQTTIINLFSKLVDTPTLIPPNFQTEPIYEGVRDYIAGMTDRYARNKAEELS